METINTIIKHSLIGKTIGIHECEIYHAHSIKLIKSAELIHIEIIDVEYDYDSDSGSYDLSFIIRKSTAVTAVLKSQRLPDSLFGQTGSYILKKDEEIKFL